jgi:hypothetical protein
MQVIALTLRGITAVLIAAATSTATLAAQDSRLLGCYDVSVSSWAEGPGFTSSPHFRIPARINLTSVRSALASTNRVTFVMRAAPGTSESAFEDATWSSDSTGATVLLRWFTPAFGIQARMSVTDTNGDRVMRLEGEAQQRSDHPPSVGSKATLTLRRVACYAQ